MPEEIFETATDALNAGVQLGGIPSPPSTWRENHEALELALAEARERTTEERITKARDDVSRRAHFDQELRARVETAARVLESYGDGYGGYAKNAVITVMAVLDLLDEPLSAG